MNKSTNQDTQFILRQGNNSLCRIYSEKNTIGIGFFCKISYQRRYINALITNYHLINENIIKENERMIRIMNNKNIERKIYLSHYDSKIIFQ